MPIATVSVPHVSSAPALCVPFASALHPEVELIQARSVLWARDLGLVGEGAGLDRLRRSRIAWLAARAYPRGDVRTLQIAADWTTLFCLLDDHIERLPGAAAVAEELAALTARLESGASAGDDTPMRRAMLDLRERLLAEGAEHLRRFQARVRELFAAFVAEAAERSAGRIPDPDGYVPMREVTVGLHVEFVIGELIAEVGLSPIARRHPLRVALARAASNIVGWANDIYTHEKEIQQGEVHNLVFVLAKAEDLALAEALARAVEMHDREVEEFVALVRAVEVDGRIADADRDALRRYAAMMTAWVRGHLDWGRETGRYVAERPHDPQ
jgi:hypothetical protein